MGDRSLCAASRSTLNSTIIPLTISAWQNLLVGIVLLVVVPLLGLALRTWLAKEIDRRVQSKFDKELEVVKSDLRLKEGKISALQSMVISRLAGKQAAIDAREIQAIEGLWDATLKLSAFRMSTTLVTILKLDALDARAENDTTAEKLLKPFLDENFKEKFQNISAEMHRPFLPEEVWKIFAAYQGLLILCQMRLQALSSGLRDTDKLFATSKVVDEIKAVMPHLSDYLDKNGLVGAAHLADPLRDLLLKAIRTTLEDSNERGIGTQRIVELIRNFEAQYDLPTA